MIGPENSSADDGGAEGAWVRRMAAVPLNAPLLPNPQVLWWRAQALRRIDADARSEAAADRIQVAVAGGGAFALLVALLLSGGSAALSPPVIALPLASSIVPLMVGIAIVASRRRAR